MEEDKLFLEDSEYFQLEAHEWKKKELQYERLLSLKDKEILKRDIALLNHSIADKRRDISKVEDKATNLVVSIENVDVAKRKVTSEISKRVGLEDVEDWGYDPETLKIIID